MALQCILEKNPGDTAALQDYFLKKKFGSCPEPVLTSHALQVLVDHYCDSRNPKAHVVVECLYEFLTNVECQKSLLEFQKNLSFLINFSVSYPSKGKETDYWMKLCNVIRAVGESGDPLSCSIFNNCAPKLLTMVLKEDLKNVPRDLLLDTICTLCRFSEQHNIISTFTKMSTDLVKLAKLVGQLAELSIESHISVYSILVRSLSPLCKEEAFKKASLWFNQYPSLINVFVKNISVEFSQSSGLFLDEVFHLSQSQEHLATKKVSDWKSEPKELTRPKGLNPSVVDRCKDFEETFIVHHSSLASKSLYSPLPIKRSKFSMKQNTRTREGISHQSIDSTFFDDNCSLDSSHPKQMRDSKVKTWISEKSPNVYFTLERKRNGVLDVTPFRRGELFQDMSLKSCASDFKCKLNRKFSVNLNQSSSSSRLWHNQSKQGSFSLEPLKAENDRSLRGRIGGNVINKWEAKLKGLEQSMHDSHQPQKPRFRLNRSHGKTEGRGLSKVNYKPL